ncbi:MAG: ferritin-like domain-containing protein, partial [Ferruginibacter sp.]
MQKKDQSTLEKDVRNYVSPVSRRKFLNYSGLSAAALLFAASCKKEITAPEDAVLAEEQVLMGRNDNPATVVNLGSGDIGILNYAYALEQLEAAFYIQVVASPYYASASAKEKEYLKDIRDHEIAHREFFKNVLGNRAIRTLEVDFSSVMFDSRDSVLGTAKAFEDLGVSAYNGAGELIQNPEYLLYAGKIVSVEARHAATLRDLISYGSFADSTAVDANGLDL